jgi:hypothetical protein
MTTIHPLADLDKVDWSSLKYAYSEGYDIAGLIRDFLTSDEQRTSVRQPGTSHHYLAPRLPL